MRIGPSGLTVCGCRLVNSYCVNRRCATSRLSRAWRALMTFHFLSRCRNIDRDDIRGVRKWYAARFGIWKSGVRATPPRPIIAPCAASDPVVATDRLRGKRCARCRSSRRRAPSSHAFRKFVRMTPEATGTSTTPGSRPLAGRYAASHLPVRRADHAGGTIQTIPDFHVVLPHAGRGPLPGTCSSDYMDRQSR